MQDSKVRPSDIEIFRATQNRRLASFDADGEACGDCSADHLFMTSFGLPGQVGNDVDRVLWRQRDVLHRQRDAGIARGMTPPPVPSKLHVDAV
jgi:hypothetical protein